MKKISGLSIIFSILANYALPAVAGSLNESSLNFRNGFIDNKISSISLISVQPISLSTENNSQKEPLRKFNIDTLGLKKVFFSEKLNLPAYKVGKISFKAEPDSKKQFIQRFIPVIPEIPRWAIITGGAVMLIGTVLVSQLKPKSSFEKSRMNFPDSASNINSFSLANNNKDKASRGSKFNIEFKF